MASALLGAGAPDAAALVDGDHVVTYGDLAARVERRGDELALAAARSSCSRRRRRSSSCRRTWRCSPVVTCRCSPTSTPPASPRRGTPTSLVDVDGGECTSSGASGRAGALLHPDLALLLSTSGSTGSPKLVRLSHDNLVSNAKAIASYLGLDAGRPGHHVAPAALLLRAVGAPLAPPRRRKRRHDHGVGRRPVLRRGHAPPRRDQRRRRAAHVRAARAGRTRHRPRPVAALRHPGRRTAGARPRPRVGQRTPGAGASTST